MNNLIFKRLLSSERQWEGNAAFPFLISTLNSSTLMVHFLEALFFLHSIALFSSIWNGSETLKPVTFSFNTQTFLPVYFVCTGIYFIQFKDNRHFKTWNIRKLLFYKKGIRKAKSQYSYFFSFKSGYFYECTLAWTERNNNSNVFFTGHSAYVLRRQGISLPRTQNFSFANFVMRNTVHHHPNFYLHGGVILFNIFIFNSLEFYYNITFFPIFTSLSNFYFYWDLPGISRLVSSPNGILIYLIHFTQYELRCLNIKPALASSFSPGPTYHGDSIDLIIFFIICMALWLLGILQECNCMR